MFIRTNFVLFVIAMLCACKPDVYAATACLSEEEATLGNLINQYRQKKGMKPIRVTKTLTSVAQWHVIDVNKAIETGLYARRSKKCNLHSWNGGVRGAPNYRSCCYTSDHEQAACMWNKPAEISQGAFRETGFEISGSGYRSVEALLEGWKASHEHNEIILNKGTWSSFDWGAMGVGVDAINRFYFVWFTQAKDPAGKARPCNS